MSFNPSVPNSGESPGVFPVQSSNNFTRLQAIITADHVFNDSAQATDGVHKQVTYIAKSNGYAPTVGGGNAELYAEVDAGGLPQLKFFNGTTTTTLTPNQSPTKIVGSVTLASGATSASIFTVPDNTFGTIFVNAIGSPTLRNYYYFYKSGSTNAAVSNLASGSSPSSPTVVVSNPDLTIKSNAPALSPPIVYAYYIIAESLL